MERDQQEKYMQGLASAIALVVGPRDEDYNKGGIGLRDYWAINGIKSPLQMVDMKLKRARSQLATWDTEQMGADCPVPTSRAQVDKLNESMFDLINYAAFVICEAESLYEEHVESAMKHTVQYKEGYAPTTQQWLAKRLTEAVHLWQKDNA